MLLVFLFLTCERSSCVKPKRSYRDMTGSGVVFAAVGRASVEGCSGVRVRRSTCIVCRSVEVECPFMLPDRLISRTCAMRCCMVSAGRLIAIVSPESAPIKRMVQEARDRGVLIDATYGRRTRAVLIMDNDHLVLSALQTETVANRLAGEREADDGEEELE